jgi:LPXTG-motif cell wall-anchored protein
MVEPLQPLVVFREFFKAPGDNGSMLQVILLSFLSGIGLILVRRKKKSKLAGGY